MRVTCLMLCLLLIGASAFGEETSPKKKSRVQAFKEKVQHAQVATSYLLSKRGAEAVDLLEPQRKDIVDLKKKYMPKMYQAEKEVGKTHDYFVPGTTIEECKINDIYRKAVYKAQQPILKEWAKELEGVLMKEQIATMNERMWRRMWMRELCGNSRIQRVLKLTAEQKAALSEIVVWAVTRDYTELGIGSTRLEKALYWAKRRNEAPVKALEVLTEQQRKDFYTLVGMKLMDDNGVCVSSGGLFLGPR